MAKHQVAQVPTVDAVIAVHSPTRPIERAVGSILDHTSADVRVTVVIHNTEPAPILDRLAAYAEDPRLRTEVLVDGVRSPSGPMNRGFDLATAPYVSLLGSDDAFDPGAIDAWLTEARRGADIVIAPVRFADAQVVARPPVRIGRSRGLRGAADRLAYHSAPLGLLAREQLTGLRFPAELPTGEDLPFTAALWFSGARISFPAGGPGYRIHEDATDRVTFEPRPLADEIRAWNMLLDDRAPWMRRSRDRVALLTKLVRVHLFDALGNRLAADAARETGDPLRAWNEQTADDLAQTLRRVFTAEPRVRRVLSRAECALVDALLRGDSDQAALAGLLARRASLRSAESLLTEQLRFVLHAQAPLRLGIAARVLAARLKRGR